MIYIELTQFEINVHLALQPTLRMVPTAIIHDKKVLYCNNPAKEHGVQVGMPVMKFRTRTKNFCTKNQRPKLYAEFSKEFYTILSNFSTTIEPVSQSSAFLDASSILGGETYAAQLIQSALTKELELPCAIGIGNSKTIARCATNLASPEGIISVEKKDEQRFLQNFPVSLFPGIDPRKSFLLVKNGIQTVHDLSQMQQHEILNLLGNSGVIIQNFAKGHDDRKLKMPSLKTSISHSIAFGHASRRYPYLLTMLHFLISKAESEAKQNHCFPKTVVVFGFAGSERIQKQISNLSQDSLRIREKTETCLLKLIEKSSRPFERIGVQFNKLVPCKKSPYFFSALHTYKQPEKTPSYLFQGSTQGLI